MPKPNKEKDAWDKIAAVTPLLLGIIITGIGAIFTQIYNYRQLQLNQVAALEKLRPLLISDKPEDREFGYASFVVLGYEEIAIRLIKIKKDESGRSILVALEKSSSPQIQEQANKTLNTLNEMQKLINVAEFGKPEPDEHILQENPKARLAITSGEIWARSKASELGVSSLLGIAILYDTAVQIGVKNAEELTGNTSASIPPPLNVRDKEKDWLTEYLNQREKKAPPSLQKAISKRINMYRTLINNGDWNLTTVSIVDSVP
jgi:hypothetical protein